MGGADVVVFTGGAGENAAEFRARVRHGLAWIGLQHDDSANTATVGGREGRSDPDSARLVAWLVSTDEKLLTARDTVRLIVGLEPRCSRCSGPTRAATTARSP